MELDSLLDGDRHYCFTENHHLDMKKKNKLKYLIKTQFDNFKRTIFKYTAQITPYHNDHFTINHAQTNLVSFCDEQSHTNQEQDLMSVPHS